MPGQLTIGTAPDSWGVWFPSDPEQVSVDVVLREVVEAGYEAIGLGPYGYLSKDPQELADTLEAHGLSVLAGTVFSHLHRPDAWDDVGKQVTDVAALTRAVGGEHIVVIQPDVERFLESTNPEHVNPCLDTGHVAYQRGDCVELITRYPERIGCTHLGQVDPGIVAEVLDQDLSSPEAVRRGSMIEPPLGPPDMAPVLEALAALDRPIKGIIDHDLHPTTPEVPLPIARRTRTYLQSCSSAAIDPGERA